MKHTPTPWKVCRHSDNGELVVRSKSDQGIVANCQCDSYSLDNQAGLEQECKANAEHIVKCVNMHDELVDALKAMVEDAGYAGATHDGLHQAETVLAKLEGGQP
jgi:hypothetical protein